MTGTRENRSSLAETAAVLADGTRAAMCLALLDGRAWTAVELATHVGVAASTASEQLSKLIAGGFLVEERQGRHRYVRLASVEVATLVEELASFQATAQPPQPRGLRESLRMSAEARARTCYDHLAGQLGVAVCDALIERGAVADGAGLAVTEAGREWLAGSALGIELPERRGAGSSRVVVRSCLDWTERRWHLGGVLGAELCRTVVGHGWVERGAGRALRVTDVGVLGFREMLGIEVTAIPAHGSTSAEASRA